MKIAILDDYQGVALQSADWSSVTARAEVTVFSDAVTDQDTLAQRLAPFDAILVMRERTPLQADLLARLPKLRFIGSNGAQNPSIDLVAAKAQGIVVCSTGGKANGAPELTWALIMATARHVAEEVASLRAGGWQTSIGLDLVGRTLGVVGLGRIGRRVAAVGQAFGMEVIAWSEDLTDAAATAAGVRRVESCSPRRWWSTTFAQGTSCVCSRTTRGRHVPSTFCSRRAASRRPSCGPSSTTW